MGLRPLGAAGRGNVGGEARPAQFDDLTDLAKAILQLGHAAGGSGRFVRTGMRASLTSNAGGRECDPAADTEIQHLAELHLLEYVDNSPASKPPIILDYTLTPRGREFGERFLQIAAGTASRLDAEERRAVMFLTEGTMASGFLELIGGEGNFYTVRSDGREDRFLASTVSSLNTAGVVLHMGLKGSQLTELGRAVAEILKQGTSASTVTVRPPESEATTVVIKKLSEVRDEVEALERSANPVEAVVLDSLVLSGIDVAMNALRAFELGLQSWATARDLVVAGVERLRAAVDVLNRLREKGLLSATADVIGIVSAAIWTIEKLF